MNTYNLASTPEVRLRSDGANRYPIDILDYPSLQDWSDESDSNHSDLREFIHEPEFQVPMLDDIIQRNSGSWNDQFNIRVNYCRSNAAPAYTDSIPRYYLLDFLLCLSVSVSICSIALTTNLILTNLNTIILMQNILQFMVIGSVLYMFTTPDTYKSTNCSIDFLPINWVFYGYDIFTMLTYVGIQIIASIVGSYAVIGMFYTRFTQLDKKMLLESIIPGDSNVLSVDSIILTLFVHLLIIIGSTFIMTQINSVNCEQTFIHALGYIYLINLIYEYTIGPIILILYKLIFYGAIVSVFNDAHDSRKNPNIIMMCVSILIKLIGYPLIAYHVKYIWIQILRRHLEYTS
jgi:hypothetical protein